jgi:hypothetical protein
MQQASGSLNYIDLIDRDFAWGGRGPELYDCYGLLKECYRRVGIELPEFKSYREPNLIQMALNEGKILFEQIEKAEFPCVVTFFIKPFITSHIGFVLPDNKKFIHIMVKSRVTVERLDSELWKDRITGFFRWRGNV